MNLSSRRSLAGAVAGAVSLAALWPRDSRGNTIADGVSLRRMGDAANIFADFNVPTDGTSDCAPSINAAITKIAAAGGGLLIIPNIGKPINIGSSIILSGSVPIIGTGMPTITLMAGANCNIMQTPNAQYVLSNPGGYTSNTDDVWLEGLILDGNYANQAKVNLDTQCGIAIAGKSYHLRRMRVKNSRGHGILLSTFTTFDYANAHGYPEPFLDDIHVAYCGGHGYYIVQQTDGTYLGCVATDASQDADGQYDGLHTVNGNQRWFHYHYWSTNKWNTTYAVARYSAWSNGWGQFFGCHFEGGHQSFYSGGYDRLTNCELYGCRAPSVNSAVMDVMGLDVMVSDSRFIAADALNSGQVLSMYGVKIGDVGTPGSVRIVNTEFHDFDSLGALNFVNSAGRCAIDARGITSTLTNGATNINGTPHATDRVFYDQTGTTAFQYRTPFALTSHDGTVAGGNALGTDAVDLQISRTLASEAATGGYSAILGGQNNTANGFAAVAAGQNNTADGQYSVAFGKNARVRGRSAVFAWGSGLDPNNNTAQVMRGAFHAYTTDATPTRMTTDGFAATRASGVINTMQLTANSTLLIPRFSVVASDAAGNRAVWSATDVRVSMGANAAATTLENPAAGNMTLETSNGTVAGWSVALSADTTNGELAITVTGQAAKNIAWAAAFDALELMWPTS